MPCTAIRHHRGELLRGRGSGKGCGTASGNNRCEIYQCVANRGCTENGNRLPYLQTLHLKLSGNSIDERRGLGPCQLFLTIIQSYAIGLVCGVDID